MPQGRIGITKLLPLDLFVAALDANGFPVLEVVPGDGDLLEHVINVETSITSLHKFRRAIGDVKVQVLEKIYSRNRVSVS